MPQIKKILFPALVLLLLSACSTVNTKEKTPLSDQETNKLISYARNIIDRLPGKKITSSEKSIIKSTAPQKRAFYNGYKSGKIILAWQFKSGKEVKYISEGNLTNFEKSFRSVNIYDVKVSSGYKGSM